MQQLRMLDRNYVLYQKSCNMELNCTESYKVVSSCSHNVLYSTLKISKKKLKPSIEIATGLSLVWLKKFMM